MCKIKIDDLPQAVKDKKITKQEAARLIWAELYVHPQKYGLMPMTEDQKSELLLNIHKSFETFLDKFVPGTVSFRTFISACIIKQKNNFLRGQAEKGAEKKSLAAYLASKTEEDSRVYAIKPEEFEKVPANNNDRQYSDITNQKVENIQQRYKKIAEITSLVLLMKACKDIDDDAIESVSNFTKIDKSLLYKTIQELKESMNHKDEVNQKLIERRNNAFFYHRKYMHEMILQQTETKRIKLLKERYEKQTKKWKNQNESLSVRSKTPSNEEIAKALGIKPRMVSFYINHVREGKNLEQIKKMLSPENDAKKVQKKQQKTQKTHQIKNFLDEES